MNSLILLIILTLVSGFFVMSELALTSARKIRLEILAKKGHSGAKAAFALAHSPNKFLSATQIAITLITIVMGVVGGEAYAEKIAPYIAPLPYIGMYARQISSVINIVFIGYVSIVFGEMIPKRIALSKPEVISQLVALPMLWIMRLLRPFVWLLSSTTDIFMRFFNIKIDESKVTEEEIKAIIEDRKSVV